MTLGCVMTVLRISEVISADRRLCNFDCQGIGERCSGFQPLKIAAIQKFKVQPFEDKRILGRVRLSRVNKSPDGRSQGPATIKKSLGKRFTPTFVSFRNSAFVHDFIEECFVDELCCVDRPVDFLRSTGKVDKQLISAYPVSSIRAEQIQELLVS